MHELNKVIKIRKTMQSLSTKKLKKIDIKITFGVLFSVISSLYVIKSFISSSGSSSKQKKKFILSGENKRSKYSKICLYNNKFDNKMTKKIATAPRDFLL